MKRNRIRTALKGAERRRWGKKKPFILRWFIVLTLNLVGKSFMFQRFIQMLAGTSPLLNTERRCFEPQDRVAEYMYARERDSQGGKLVGEWQGSCTEEKAA